MSFVKLCVSADERLKVKPSNDQLYIDNHILSIHKLIILSLKDQNIFTPQVLLTNYTYSKWWILNPLSPRKISKI